MRSFLVLSLVFLVGSFAIQQQVRAEVAARRYIERSADTLRITSFNIQFLGSFKSRDHLFLADLVKNSDLVCIEELVAPPVSGVYPDGYAFTKDKESAVFHDRMIENGFSWWLSPEDTGPKSCHSASSASEWWVVYYKSEQVFADTLIRCYGFLSAQTCGDSIFDRVPYAFPFKFKRGELDFTLIPVHLRPGDRLSDQAKRSTELKGIYNWVNTQEDENCDYYVLGDFNFKNSSETQYQLSKIEEELLVTVSTLNTQYEATNTKRYELASKGKPYDHVLHGKCSHPELLTKSFQVVDLLLYTSEAAQDNYVYDHDVFRTKYSDHLPIQFCLITGMDQD